ncbi:hypothetical protein BJX99DRAFT_228926 [Aspergillus californicus]
MEDLHSFLASLGQEVEDAEEESFLLFAQDIPSSNLGFVDSRATTIDIPIHDQDYTIHQSPTLLSSSRAGGTTGAVLWKITPLFAEWISDTSNPLWANALLSPSSSVVELGCGISGLTALTLAPLVNHYLATDQEYVHRLFRLNLESNPPRTQTPSSSSGGKSKGRKQAAKINPKSNKDKSNSSSDTTNGHPNITFTSLDWELDHPETLKQNIPTTNPPIDEEEEEDKGFTLLLSCDCIYNEALIAPFVRTCAEISRLRPILPSSSLSLSPTSPFPASRARGTPAPESAKPTICIIAQQQRSPDVFEGWLVETMKYFRVWRVNEDLLGGKLGGGSGYLVHVLVLKGDK